MFHVKRTIKAHKIKLSALCLLTALTLVLVYEFQYTNNLDAVRWRLKYALRALMRFPSYTSGVVLNERLELPETVLMDHIDHEQPNAAVAFWWRHKDKELRHNATCAPLPNLFRLAFANAYWQLAHVAGGPVHLYAAYWDNRPKSQLNYVVRVLAMVGGNVDKAQLTSASCQVWYEDSKEPVLTKVYAVEYIWMEGWGDPQPGGFKPYLLTCVLPIDLTPMGISIVERACDTATNLLKVHNERPAKGGRKKGFAVCVKGRSEMTDTSVALVEWLEWLKILGIDAVYMYTYHVHPQMLRVLQHYSNQGFVVQQPLVLAGNDPNSPYMQYYFLKTDAYNYQFDLIAYNDCLLRNLYLYDYVLPLELDELPVPQTAGSVGEIIKQTSGVYAAYCLRKATFVEDFNDKFEDVPAYLRLLRDVYRLRDFAPVGMGIRCFCNTNTMVTIHNHYPLKALQEPMTTLDLDPSQIYLEQHVDDCKEPNCAELKLFDSRKWVFKDELVRNTKKTLNSLRFL